ncbi:MAG TPA: hypothetical protein VGS19_09725, partial [Streptosporangiaceae bacterium]|nr:hypothetical protein [Streptosporangiaceae bacterium]
MDEMERLSDMCEAVPPPDTHRLVRARARLDAAIAQSRRPASRAAWRTRMAAFSLHGRTWSGWVTPLAAAAAAAAVIAGTQAAVSAFGGPPQARSAERCPRPGPRHPLTVYVASYSSRMVTPIDVATSTPLS